LNQQVQAHEALFVKTGTVLNLGHLDFEIVQDFSSATRDERRGKMGNVGRDVRLATVENV
jgi:hypothetical protein